jgi:hypothetical protein
MSIFFDLYVPAFTPRLNSTETSLQLSENIPLFAVCRIYTVVISKEAYIDIRCLGPIIYIYCTGGQDGTWCHPSEERGRKPACLKLQFVPHRKHCVSVTRPTG